MRPPTDTRGLRRVNPGTAVSTTLSVLLIWQLKRYAAAADVSDLGWLLSPVVLLCNLVPGICFEQTPAGWVDTASHSVIMPACSGINFFLICFSLAVFYSISSGRSRPVWLPLCAGIAWLVTLGANSLRILLSIACYRTELHSALFDPAEVHRLIGVGIYYLFLLFFSLLFSRIVTAGERVKISGRVVAAPLCCYLFFVVAVPLVRGAWRQNSVQFTGHALTVTAVVLVLTLVFRGTLNVQSVAHLLWYRQKKQRKNLKRS